MDTITGIIKDTRRAIAALRPVRPTEVRVRESAYDQLVRELKLRAVWQPSEVRVDEPNRIWGLPLIVVPDAEWTDPRPWFLVPTA